MDIPILIFLTSLGIILADSISALRSFQAEPHLLNSKIKQDILDIFKRSGSDSPTVVSFYSESDPVQKMIKAYGGYKLPPEVKSVPVKGDFSLFRQDHKKALVALIRHFEEIGNVAVKYLLRYFKDIKPNINLYLFQAAYSNVLINMSIKDLVPPVCERFPEDFVAGHLLNGVKEGKNITVFREKRQVNEQGTVSWTALTNDGYKIYQRLDLSGTDQIPEHRVAYFREDHGMNSHHYNWHSTAWSFDRKDEYFIYMHSQMLKRYNIERLSVNLKPVVAYSNFNSPIEVGHKSNLGFTEKTYGVRDNNMTPKETANNVDMPDKGKLEEQIRRQIVDDDHFMDNFYGYHGDGHGIISRTVRKGEPRNIMEKSATSARDNVFFRWHQHIDDLYEEYAKMKRRVRGNSLTYEEMAFDDIEMRHVYVQSYNIYDRLLTGCGYHRLDITDGLDFQTDGTFLEMTHLDHVPFTYTIEFTNKAKVIRSGVVRIFLAPVEDERGNRMGIEQQRKYWIEMDKFRHDFESGYNEFRRKSSESSVTVDCRKNGHRLENNGKCGCGWPQHLLVPRGKTQGMKFNLLAIVTNENNIQDWRVGDSTYCGMSNEEFSDNDRREMGYPFHAPAPDNTWDIRDFSEQLSNSAVTDISIYFRDVQTNLNEDPVDGCGRN